MAKKQLRAALGVGVSVLLLAWAVRDVSLSAVLHELESADFSLLLLTAAIAVSGLGIRAVRWGILLQPVAPRVPYHPRFASIVIGFAVNNLIPARVGEFARAFSLARLGRVPVAAAIATLVVERIFDALVLVVLLFAAMASDGFPAGDIAGVDPRAAARVVAVMLVVAGVVLYLLVLMPRRAMALARAVAERILPARMRQPVLGALESFLDGFAVLRSGRLFLVSLVLAFVNWLFLALSFVTAFRAFSITRVPFAGAVFLQSLTSLAVAVPSTPGFFGPFEAAARLGLRLWHVPPDRAVSFAVGLHLAGFIPVTLLGLYFVWRLDLTWREIKHGGNRLADEARSEHDDTTQGPALREGV